MRRWSLKLALVFAALLCLAPWALISAAPPPEPTTLTFVKVKPLHAQAKPRAGAMMMGQGR